MPKILMLVAVAVAIALSIFIFPRKSSLPPSQPVTSSTTQSSRYIDYSPQSYAKAADKRRVLYFYATWCPTCSVANEDFTVNSSRIPEDAVIFRTDYDQETALKAKYGITYQHTFVQVDKSGNELAKWNGGGLNELINQLTD